MRFRERHQDPNGTDLEYAARINNSRRSTTSSRRIPVRPGSSRWSASSPACRSSIRWSSASGRSRCRNICGRAPTRRSSPSAMAAAFSCIYSVRGAGGYQMFGITPMPIYDPNQKISYLRDFMCLFKPGDIVKWKPIDRDGLRRGGRRCRSRPLRADHSRRVVLAHRIQPRHRRLQSQARGGSPWPLRFSSPVLRPPFRTSAVPATITSASRSPAAWTGLRSRAANLLVGNDGGSCRSRSRLHGARARIYR